MGKIQVLIDSDAWVGRFYTKDPHHEQVLSIFAKLEGEETSIVTTNLVVIEVATVLSHRSGQALARTFLTTIEKAEVPIIHIDEDLQKAAIEIFKEQEARGTSVVDCSNVAVMKHFQIPQIFSFDKFYSKQPGLKTIT